MIVAVLAVAAAVAIGATFGWKFVFAPLLGFAVFRFATANLRAMVNDGRAQAAAEAPQPRPATADERVHYWCEECGVEVVLVIHGSGQPPRHCGSKMHERAEVLRN